MLDLSQITLLRPRDYALFGFDVDKWVPVRVLRARPFAFPYTFAKDVGGFNGAASSTWKNLSGGASNMPVLANAPANSYVLNQSAAFQAVSGVSDALQVTQDYEILQAFYGIAPSPLRVYFQQPVSQFTTMLDQNVVPLQQSEQVIDVGFLDGFDSPYNRPSPASEFFSFKNIQVQFSMANPVPEQIAPRLNFVINRMKCAPVSDPATVQGIFRGTIPAKVVTIGDTMSSVNWTGSGYGGVGGLPSSLDVIPLDSVKSVLQKLNYLKAAAAAPAQSGANPGGG
jgi:hypothetical protein